MRNTRKKTYIILVNSYPDDYGEVNELIGGPVIPGSQFYGSVDILWTCQKAKIKMLILA